MPTVEVLPVTRASSRAAADAVAAGFHDNEIWVWMVPRPWVLRRMLPRHYRHMIRSVYLPRGGAWTTADCQGAALWHPPGRYPLSRREGYREALSLMPWGAAALRRGARMDELMREHHPREPHWYLQTLAVRPELQGKGVGSALITPGLDRADAERLPSYLETQRRANIPFYRRFGFEETGEIKLPDSPPLWTMWRPAS